MLVARFGQGGTGQVPGLLGARKTDLNECDVEMTTVDQFANFVVTALSLCLAGLHDKTIQNV